MSENIIKQPRWKTCEYTQRQVNDAGKVVCLEEATLEEKEHAVEIMLYWFVRNHSQHLNLHIRIILEI